MVNSQAKGRNSNVKVKAIVILKRRPIKGENKALTGESWVYMFVWFTKLQQKQSEEITCSKWFGVFNKRTQPFIKDPQQHSAYPASRGHIFAVWAVMQKVASADNRSIFYHASMKIVTRLASKINHQVCCQTAQVSRGKKNCDNSDLLHKAHARLAQCSNSVKNRKKPVF